MAAQAHWCLRTSRAQQPGRSGPESLLVTVSRLARVRQHVRACFVNHLLAVMEAWPASFCATGLRLRCPSDTGAVAHYSYVVPDAWLKNNNIRTSTPCSVCPPQVMAACCLAAGLRHCPSAAAHQMVSLLVRQRGGAAAAAAALLLPPSPPSPQQPQQPQYQPGATPLYSLRSGTSGGGAPAAVVSHPNGGGGDGGAAAAASAAEHQALCVSLAHARRALEMDLEAGYSWCEFLCRKALALLYWHHPARHLLSYLPILFEHRVNAVRKWCMRCCYNARLLLHLLKLSAPASRHPLAPGPRD